MIVPREILQKHTESALLIEEVASRVRDTVQSYCVDNGFIFDGRPKTVESLAEKIETGRFRSWSDLDDLYACTIGVPLPANEEAVLDFLTSSFYEVRTQKRHAANKPPDVFRFDSTRFVGRLHLPGGMERDNSIFGINFEIQIKSLFELAWSKTTHALAYKTSRVDWRALRLSAALKASVEQIDLLLSDYEHAMMGLGESPWREVQQKSTIQDTFLNLKDRLPTEVWPKDLSRFVDNCYYLITRLQSNERWLRRDRNLEILDSALKKISTYISNATPEEIPRSISIFQLVFAILTETYQLPSGGDTWYPITSEMEDLFPHLVQISHRFQFS